MTSHMINILSLMSTIFPFVRVFAFCLQALTNSLNLNGSLNSSMTMKELSKTLPQLPSQLDRSRLPKIPGLELAGSDKSFSRFISYFTASKLVYSPMSYVCLSNINKRFMNPLLHPKL